MSGDDKHPFRVISTNSEEDLAVQRARDELNWPLRDLAANMIRVARGAGKPAQLYEQMIDVVRTMKAYLDHRHGEHLEADIREALEIATSPPDNYRDDGWSSAERRIVRGSLQVAASKLVCQAPQEAAGKNEIMEGYYAIERIRDANRAAARAGRLPKFSQRKKSAKKT